MREMIHWKLYKRLRYDRPIKWHMYKQESVLENEMHTIIRIWYSNGSPNQNQKTRPIANLQSCVLCHEANQIENRRKQKDWYFARELRTVEH